MIILDEDALICDFAETYHIYDYRGLRPTLAGVLACGLRNDSRIKLKMSGMNAPLDEMLLATIADRVDIQIRQYAKTHNAKDIGDFTPIVENLINGTAHEKKNENATFNSGEDFMRAWKEGADV